MDYDKIYEIDINQNYFYTNYPGNKLMVGKISLNYAIERLKKNEYYTLVAYTEGEELPKEYIPLKNLTNDNGILFATVNPNINFWDICRNGGIQRISQLARKTPSDSPRYLLGPGPDIVSLEDIIAEQYNKHYKLQQETKSKGR